MAQRGTARRRSGSLYTSALSHGLTFQILGTHGCWWAASCRRMYLCACRKRPPLPRPPGCATRWRACARPGRGCRATLHRHRRTWSEWGRGGALHPGQGGKLLSWGSGTCSFCCQRRSLFGRERHSHVPRGGGARMGQYKGSRARHCWAWAVSLLAVPGMGPTWLDSARFGGQNSTLTCKNL